MKRVTRVVAMSAWVIAGCHGDESRAIRAERDPEASANARASSTSLPSSTSAPSSAPSARYLVPAPGPEEDLVNAPVVHVDETNRLRLDATDLGVVDEPTKLHKIDALYQALAARRTAWREMHPDGTFPGVVIIDVNDSVVATVVKSVFQTSAFAGFPNVHFVVHNPPPRD